MAVDKKTDPPKEEKVDSQKTSFRSLDHAIEEVEGLLRELDEASGELETVSQKMRRTHWELGHRVVPHRQWPRQTAILLASFAAASYLIFRTFFTLNLENPFAVAFSITLLAAEAYGLFHLSLYFYQIWQLDEPPVQDAKTGKTVDVFVTTYNEDVALLRNTLRACVDMEYPHTTYVLDDGQRDEVRRLAEELGVRYITRSERIHAKAGNVNHALGQTNGEFVILLDADHVPHMHFIRRMIGYFNDPKVGFVQAPHTTYNLDNFQGRWRANSRSYWEDVRLFFEAVQLGKNRYECVCFCGSAAMFRRKALEEVGLLATETITEDLHTGMRINAAGWKSLAISEELVVGLAPEDPDISAQQRLRWGEGNLSVMAYDNPLTMKGLRPSHRINYLASILNWTYGPARLVMYLVPIVMLLTNTPPVSDLTVTYIAIVSFYLIAIWVSIKMASNRCGDLLGIELAMMSSFHIHIRAIWRALFRRRSQKFVVTAKRREKQAKKRSILWRMWPQASIVALGLIAISWATTRVVLGLSIDYFGLAVCSLLALYHAWLGVTILRQASRPRDPDAQWRHPIRLPVKYEYGTLKGQAATLNINEDGLALLTPDRLPESTSIKFAVYSPFTEARCLGEVVGTRELTHVHQRMFVHEIAFRNPDPTARQAEIDATNKLLFGYVVPWMIQEYRGKLSWLKSGSYRSERKNQISLTVEVNAPNSAMPSQTSVTEQMDRRGLTTTLPYPLTRGTNVELTIRGPVGDLVARARVSNVLSIPVGITIVYQHRLEWIKPMPETLPATLHWVRRAYRYDTDFARPGRRKYRVMEMSQWMLAASLLVALTVGLFWATHRGELLLIAATERPLTPAETQRVEAINESGIGSRYISANRLLRMYHAAVETHLPRQAAQLATRLAEKIPEERCRWNVTAAHHWVQSGEYQIADRLFKQVIASGCDRQLPPEERATIYMEAAHVALAVGKVNRSVDLFSKASHFKTFGEKQIDEYIGLLIAANKLPQAVQLLKQQKGTDGVLRRIVAVYEIAKQAQQAVGVLETLHERHPDDTEVLQRLAELAYERGDNKDAFHYYGDLLKLKPDDQEIEKRLAGVLAATGRTDEAVDLLRDTKDPESRMLLASILETAGRFEEAIEQLQRITGPATETPAYREQFVRLLLATQKYDPAVVVLIKYLDLYPDDPKLQQSFIDAVAASHIGSPGYHVLSSEALAAAQQAMRHIYDEHETNDFRGLDLDGLQQLAYALQHLDMGTESIGLLNFGVKHYPDSRSLRFQLAQALSNLGRYEAAEVQYVILLKSSPK